jgi:hypothetical protein
VRSRCGPRTVVAPWAVSVPGRGLASCARARAGPVLVVGVAVGCGTGGCWRRARTLPQEARVLGAPGGKVEPDEQPGAAVVRGGPSRSSAARSG